jgi:predicted anti-sigma-YlaC factor YlaD
MDCDHARREILLGFSRDQETLLSPFLRVHLADCDDCTVFYAEQARLAAIMPDDSRFHPSPAETATLLRTVESRIDRLQESRSLWQSAADRWSSRWNWRQLIPAAVSLVFTFALGMLASQVLVGGDQSGVIVSSQAVDPLGIDAGLAETEPDDTTVTTLLWDVSASYQSGAGDRLLVDISEEEYDYILNNLDVRDLL